MRMFSSSYVYALVWVELTWYQKKRKKAPLKVSSNVPLQPFSSHPNLILHLFVATKCPRYDQYVLRNDLKEEKHLGNSNRNIRHRHLNDLPSNEQAILITIEMVKCCLALHAAAPMEFGCGFKASV